MRLIDAHELATRVFHFETARNRKTIPYNLVYQTIVDTPTHNPWRKIDDVDGLLGDEVIVVKNNGRFAKLAFYNDSCEAVCCYGDNPAVEDDYTHYMAIPPLEVEE